MRKFLLILIFAGLAHAACAGHVPGYMGKRFSVGYNASSFFLFDQVIPLSDLLFNTRFSYKSELALNYTVSRKVSLGFSYYYGKQGYKPAEYYYETSNYNSSEVIPKGEFIDCQLMIFEFNTKIYHRNFIAPIGPYHQIGLGIVKYKAVAPGDSLVLVSPESANNWIDVIELKQDPFSCVKLSYHVGYSAPVFSNCYFNFAVGVNFFRGGDSARYKGGGTINDRTYVQAVLNKHLRRHNFLEVKLGLGWLAF